MINWRLYRASFLPVLLAVAVAAFSLQGRPRALTSTLAPEAFEGQRAMAELRSMLAAYPDRRPGSAGDDALARYVARTLAGLGGAGTHGAAGGFSVHSERVRGQTIEGERWLTTVIAQRPGSTDATPILIVAHRDAAAKGAEAELSGTAALLELARVLAARETKRTIVLASTSGGSGGAAGAAGLLRASVVGTDGEVGQGRFDAAIVLGDLAGTRASAPIVLPFSDGEGSAPLELQRTVAGAIAAETGVMPGAPSTWGALAHLAFPLAAGEQGVLDAQGLPTVLVQVSGERGPSSHERVSGERLQGFGRAVLNAVDALDAAPDVTRGMDDSLPLQRKTMPAWALRILVIALLAPALVAVVDGLARARRRRLAVGRWTLWACSCALPFFTCALFAYLLGWLGILGAAPSIPVLPSALPLDGKALTAVVAVVLTFALAWLLWAALLRRLGWSERPDPQVAGLALLLVAAAIVVVAWLHDPFAALLALPAMHAWLVLSSARPRRRAGARGASVGALLLVAVGLLPLALLIAFYAHQLGLGPGDVAWMALLLVAGGHVAFLGAVLWSLALGCAAAAALLATMPRGTSEAPRVPGEQPITMRGPLSYAGPGSLGGTESALRR